MTKNQSNAKGKKKVVRISSLKDLPKGAKPINTGKPIEINDNPRKIKVPLESKEMQNRMNAMSNEELQRFLSNFGTLYVEE